MILLAQTRQAERDNAPALAEQQTAQLLTLLQQNTELTTLTQQMAERIGPLTLQLTQEPVVPGRGEA